MKPLTKDVWSLFDVSAAMETGGPEAYLDKILDNCSEWFGATGGSLFLWDETTGRYTIRASVGSGGSIPKDAAFEPEEGIAGACVTEKTPLLVGDPENEPTLSGPRRGKQALVSAMVVPLIAPQGGCIGVMNLSRREGLKPFRPQDLRQANSVAGHIALAVANARLYSELRAAKHEAVTAEAKLQSIIDGLGVAVLVIEADGRVHYRNQVAEELLWEQKLAGNTGHRLDPHADSELGRCLRECLAGALRGNVSRSQARDADRQRAWSIVCTPLTGGGATAAIEDVTDHERTLQEIGRVRRLAEIGQMTASIAHEVRNPLTGIRSAAQLIREAPDQAAEFAQIIEEETMKLNHLCEEFLDFAKPLVLGLRPVSLGDLARRVGRSVQAQFDRAEVRLGLEIPGAQPTILGDEARLEQVLRNLMLNALQACHDGGLVTVVVRANGFSVEDNGSGMEDETVHKLFTAFFTTKAKGTGLGLSNVRKIVEAHGGQIRVRSHKGMGSRFDVWLMEEQVG